MMPPKPAEHIGIHDTPFVTVSEKVALQLLQVDLTQGLWVLRARFQPGYEIETHRHTGLCLPSPRRGAGSTGSIPTS